MSPITVQSLLETVREQGWLEKIKDKRFLVRLGINAVIFLVLVFVLILPTFKSRGGLKAKLDGLKSQIQIARTNIANLPKLQEEEQGYRKDIATVQNTIWSESEAANLISILSELARESKVVITGSEPEDYPEDFPEGFQNFYGAKVIHLECEADYHAFGTFMSKVESYERLIKVIRFVVTSFEGMEKERIELSLAVFSTTETGD